jgi:hypothetical protein
MLVDAVEHRDDAVRTTPVPNQLRPDLFRDRDNAIAPAKHSLVGGIIQIPLAGAVSRPAVRRGHRNRPLRPGEQHGEQIGLVVVRVHDLNAVTADDVPEPRPDRRIDRRTLRQLDISQVEFLRAAADVTAIVIGGAQIADRDLERSPIAQRGARENRLLRTATGSENAAQLEHANRHHPASCI